MRILPLLLLSCLILQFENCFSQETKSQSGIKWLTFEQALSQSQKNPKKIFIDVYTKWCGWCKKMDATTFEDPAVVSYMNQHFYAVKLDAETHDTLMYQNKAYTFNPEYKSNEIAPYLLNGQMGYPTSVYLDEESNPIGPVPGFLTKEQLIPVMRYFAENLYKTKNWEQYVQENSK